MKIEKREMQGKDYRYFPSMGLSIEKREDGKPTKIVGHAAVFDVPKKISWFVEEWNKGAFKRTIKESDIRALFNHDPNWPLGRNMNNTLELREDDTGLYFEVTPPETTWAKDLMLSIERGDVTGASIGFWVRKQEWSEEEENGQKIVRRKILDAELADVSPVTFPAFEETDVAVRSSVEKEYETYKKSIAETVKAEREKEVSEIQLHHSLRLKLLEILEKEV